MKCSALCLEFSRCMVNISYYYDYCFLLLSCELAMELVEIYSKINRAILEEWVIVRCIGLTKKFFGFSITSYGKEQTNNFSQPSR